MLYFYLFSVTGVALFVFVVSIISGVNGLFDFVFQVPMESWQTVPEYQSAIAMGLGYALISLPVWWHHWRRLITESPRFDNTFQTFYRFYLFTVVCLSVMFGLIVGGAGFSNAIRFLLGFGESRPDQFANLASAFTLLAVAAALWIYHWRQFRGHFGSLKAPVEPAA
jgi:hypothetical protein